MTTKYEDNTFKVPELPVLMHLIEEDKIAEQRQLTANLLSDIVGPIANYIECHGEISEEIAELLAIDAIDALEESMISRKMIVNRTAVAEGVRIYVNRASSNAQPCLHEFFDYLMKSAVKTILERHNIEI